MLLEVGPQRARFLAGLALTLAASRVALAQQTPPIGRDGFSWKSADGDFVLRLRGYIQLDGRFFSEETPAGTDTFLLRRVRPIFEGTVFKIFDFRVMPDFGQGTSVLFDGYVEARFSPALRLRFRSSRAHQYGLAGRRVLGDRRDGVVPRRDSEEAVLRLRNGVWRLRARRPLQPARGGPRRLPAFRQPGERRSDRQRVDARRELVGEPERPLYDES